MTQVPVLCSKEEKEALKCFCVLFNLQCCRREVSVGNVRSPETRSKEHSNDKRQRYSSQPQKSALGHRNQLLKHNWRLDRNTSEFMGSCFRVIACAWMLWVFNFNYKSRMLIYQSAIPSPPVKSVSLVSHQLPTQYGTHWLCRGSLYTLGICQRPICSFDLVLVIFSICIHSIWFWLRKLIKSCFYNDF